MRLPCAPAVKTLSQLVAIVGPVRQQGLPFHESVEHIGGTAPVMGLALEGGATGAIKPANTKLKELIRLPKAGR